MYFWTWVFPPLALLMCGRPFQAFLNLLLFCTGFGIPFSVLWGYLAVAGYYADRRTDRVVAAIERNRPYD